MGYLLGLFISLIQQLNIQRGINPNTNRTIIDGVPMNASHKTNEPNHVHNNSMRGSLMGHKDSDPNSVDKSNHNKVENNYFTCTLDVNQDCHGSVRFGFGFGSVGSGSGSILAPIRVY